MKTMSDIGWAIVYIRGTAGFQEEVLPKLREKYLSGNLETDQLMMIWVPDVRKLRNLKLVIGSKIILKFRLHFLTNISPHSKLPNKPSARIVPFENELVSQMTVWQNQWLEQPEMLVE